MKVIEADQEFLITCDNPTCDYTIVNETRDWETETKQYINMPCPKCGENLLTQEDYDTSKMLQNMIKWINKWFGWLSIFITKKKAYKSVVHVHKGIHIKDEK